jgi:hypothetical protein
VTLLGAGEPGTSARFVPLWDRTVPARLGEPYPEVMHALRVRREIARIAETEGVDIVHDHTFAGPLNAPAYKALGLPTVVTVHGPIDDDLYQYYRELGDEVGLIAISDRQRELASELNWVGRVHNALRIEDWPFQADKGDYALFLGRFAPYKGAHLALQAAHDAAITAPTGHLPGHSAIEPVSRTRTGLSWSALATSVLAGAQLQRACDGDLSRMRTPRSTGWLPSRPTPDSCCTRQHCYGCGRCWLEPTAMKPPLETIGTVTEPWRYRLDLKGRSSGPRR